MTDTFIASKSEQSRNNNNKKIDFKNQKKGKTNKNGNQIFRNNKNYIPRPTHLIFFS